MSEPFWPQVKILCETVKYYTTEHQAKYPLKKQYWKKKCQVSRVLIILYLVNIYSILLIPYCVN